jgi:hypothetical protein
MDDKLIVFKKRGILATGGDGPNSLGAGNFFIPEQVASDSGCINHRSILLYPIGLFFQSEKGLYRLNRALQVDYAGVKANSYFDGKTVNCASIIPTKNHARFYIQDGFCACYDYLLDSWSTIEDRYAIDTIYSAGKEYLTNGVKTFYESAFINNMPTVAKNVEIEFETSWLEVSTLQALQRIYRILILGHYYGASSVTMRTYRNYETTNYEQYSATTENDNGMFQFRFHVANQKGQTIKIWLKETSSGIEALSFSGMMLEVGLKKGTFKTKSSKQG